MLKKTWKGELELATLPELLAEISNRGIKFIFVGQRTFGKQGKKEDEYLIKFESDELVTPIRMSAEALDTVLDLLVKAGMDDAVTKTLTSVLLQLDVLLGVL
jgi:hypothetical protein